MPRRKYNNLRQQMQDRLDAAAAAHAAGNETEYRIQMDKANALRPQVEQLQRDIDTIDAFGDPTGGGVPGGTQDLDTAQNLVSRILNQERVSLVDIRNALGLPSVSNSVLVSTATAAPTAAGAVIRGGDRPMTDMMARANEVNLEGVHSILEPYVRTEAVGAAGKLTDVAGKARASTDPEFGNVKLSAYEASVTLYVDKNLARISPAAYLAKVLQLAERAWRKKVNSLMIKGDGQASPEMHGILNAKDVSGNSMVRTVDISALSETTISEIVFAYGGNEDLGVNGELHLTKEDLRDLGKIRGAYDKKKVYEIIPTPGTSGGVIRDGGMSVPYFINSNLTPISKAADGDDVMFYGDPFNYELGRHGDLTIVIDGSYKAAERMHTILADGVVSGNVTVEGGFIVAKYKAAE